MGWGRDGRREPATPGVQLAALAVLGLAAGAACGVLYLPSLGPVVGWNAAAAAYLAWTWWTLWPMDATRTAQLALREDPNRALRDLLLLGACVVSLVAVGVVLIGAQSQPGYRKELHAVLGVVSVVLSWAVVHTIFTARYARIYYTGPDGGIDFNQPAPPRYSDFAYVSFTIGTTFQVSDTDVTSHEMRVHVLRHTLLSYLFGSIIIAATINLLAGLVH
ncbi:DUF1345 domain-containing protein [Micromonospora sp. NPDC049559]|uniref:DUF1345 domain-containing protein n=1 Tax=Micromonospora sp. NPDC049559 TaxID=3155923 RepID=UPI0034135650